MRKADLEVGDLVQVKMFRDAPSGREEACWMDGQVVAFGKTLVNVRVKKLLKTWPFPPRHIRRPRK